jgi:predicted small secreted protein
MKDTTTTRSAAFLSAMFPEAKRHGFLAVCAVLMVGALVLAGCDNSTSPGSGDDGGKTFPAEMIGTWTKDSATMTIESGKMTVDVDKYVVYRVSGKTIQIKFEGYDNWFTFCTDWSVTGNTLVLSGSSSGGLDGTWIKQGGGGRFPAEMIGTWTKDWRTLRIESLHISSDWGESWVYSINGKTIKIYAYYSPSTLCTDWSVTGDTLVLSGGDDSHNGTWTKRNGDGD